MNIFDKEKNCLNNLWTKNIHEREIYVKKSLWLKMVLGQKTQKLHKLCIMYV